jgi:hypothetical protein
MNMTDFIFESFGEGWRVKRAVGIPNPVDSTFAPLKTSVFTRNYVADE